MREKGKCEKHGHVSHKLSNLENKIKTNFEKNETREGVKKRIKIELFHLCSRQSQYVIK